MNEAGTNHTRSHIQLPKLIMVISNRKIQQFPLKIRNCELSRVQKDKLLGVIVDEKLNFKDHVNCIQKRYPDPLKLFIESKTIFRLLYS